MEIMICKSDGTKYDVFIKPVQAVYLSDRRLITLMYVYIQ